MIPGKPKLGLPGSPGVIKVGGDHHGGHGITKAVVDDYPVKYGLRITGKPESAKTTPVYRVKKRVK